MQSFAGCISTEPHHQICEIRILEIRMEVVVFSVIGGRIPVWQAPSSPTRKLGSTANGIDQCICKMILPVQYVQTHCNTEKDGSRGKYLQL